MTTLTPVRDGRSEITEAHRRLAAIAGAATIAFSVGIWALASQSRGDEPPDLVSRGLASAVLLAVPGIIGLIGAALDRRTVLIAAGVLCLMQAAISFTGVTLLYIVPGIMFLRSGADRGEPAPTEPIRPLRLVLAAIVSVPVAFLAIMTAGILGVVLIALIAGLAASWGRGRPGGTLAEGDAVRGIAIVLLVVGAWAATFVLTETVCWIAHESPGRGVTWERIPPTNSLTLDAGDVSGGCAGGTITPNGAALMAMLLAVAGAVAVFPGRRLRREDSEVSERPPQ